MAYQGNPTRLPAGLGGLALRENRLLSKPNEYIDAEGVTFEDHHERKEAGAVSLDADGLSGAPQYTGTISSGDPWGAGLARLDGTGIATGGTAASTDATSSGTTQVVTVPAGGYASGSLVVVHVVMSNVTNTITSVTDDGSNTYTAFRAVATVGDATVSGRYQTFASILGTALSAGEEITVTYGGILSQGAIVVGNWTGVDSAVPEAFGTAQNNSDSATAVTVGPLFPAAPPYLEIVGLATATATFAPGGDPIYTETIELNGTNMTATLHSRLGTTAPTIHAIHDFHSDEVTAGAGTVTTAPGSTTVTGSGTAFNTSAVNDGDFIEIGTESRQVASIAGATSLTTTEAWVTTNSGVAYNIRAGQRLITAATDGIVYRERDGNLDADSLETSLSVTARPGRFVQGGKEAAAGNRKLFYLNGADTVRVLDGNGSMSTITSPPSDWSGVNQPLNGAIHRNRFVAWGNKNDPNRIYISDPDDHENFTTPSATTQRVASNVGDRVIGGVSYNGVLWLFKYPNGIFYLDDQDLSVSNWVVFTKSEALGCTLSPYSVLALDDDILFLNQAGGFHLLSAVNTLGGVEASDLSSALGIDKWIQENVNLAKLDQVTSVWYPAKLAAYFGVPGTGDSTNSLTLKFDFSGVAQGQPVKFSYSRRDAADALALRRDSDGVQRPVLGEGGKVYLLDQDDRNKDDVGYDAVTQTPHLDFSYVDESLEYKRKNWDALELVMEPVSAGTITLEVYVDTVLRETLTFDATVRRQRKTLHVGDGFTLSLKVTNSTVDEDFRILSKNVFFRVGNEDHSRPI